MDHSKHTIFHWWEITVPRQSGRVWALVSVVYLVLALVWTWPLILNFGDKAIQGTSDAYEPNHIPVDSAQNTWNMWLFRTHWADGNWPLSTERIFYPQRLNLTYQTYGLPNLLIAAPIAALFGDLVAINVLVLLGFIVGALAVYALLLAYGVDDWLAFGLGWVFVVTPAHLAVVYSSGIEQTMLGWLLLVHWAVARLVHQPGWRYSLLLATVLVLVSLVSGYYGLFGLVYCGVMILHALTDSTVRQRWHRITIYAAASVTMWALLMVTLMSWPSSGYIGQRDLTKPSILSQSLILDDWYLRQTYPFNILSLLDVVTPPHWHLFWRLTNMSPTKYPYAGIGDYLGFGVLLLVIYAVWSDRRSRLLLVATAVLLWLACGPEVSLWAGQTSNKMPGLYALLNLVSVYKNASRPVKFLYYAWIPLILLVAVALQRITIRHRVWAGMIMVLLCIDFHPVETKLLQLKPSLAASHIPKDGPAGSVMEVPARMDDGRGLIDQMCHGRPIASGYLARVPDFYVTPIHGVATAPSAIMDVIPTFPLREMGNLGVSYLVVHSDAPYYVLDNLTKWNVPLVAKVQGERVFRIPPPDEAALVADNNWWEGEYNDSTRWRWSKAESRLIILSNRAKIIRIAMTMSSMSAVTAHWRLNGVDFYTSDIPAQPHTISQIVSLPIVAGVNYLDVRSPTTTVDGREVGVAFTRLEIVGSSALVGSEPIAVLKTDQDTPLCQ